MSHSATDFSTKFQRAFEMRAEQRREPVVARYTVLCGVSAIFYLTFAIFVGRNGFPTFGLPTWLHGIVETCFTVGGTVFALVRLERAINRPVAIRIDGVGIAGNTAIGSRQLAWNEIDRIEREDFSLMCMGDTLTFHAKQGAAIVVPLNLIDKRLAQILAKIDLHRRDLIVDK